jgi:hypothetical protein
MSANKKNTKTNTNANRPTGAVAKNIEVEADVLFQKLYGKWYAFSELDGECLVSEVSDDEVQKRITTGTTPALRKPTRGVA